MVNFFSLLLQQLSALFGSQSAARRFVVLSVVVGSIGLLAYVAMRAQSASYKPVLSNVQQSEAARAIGTLQMIGIPAKLGDGGTSVLVPMGKRWDQALIMLSQEGFPNSGSVGYEIMDKSSIGRSDFEQKIRFHRSLEGELARTIATIDGIDRAKVHLAMPKQSVFVSDQVKPSASVVIKTWPGATLSDDEVRGISVLVSRAVGQGMEPEDVSVVDTRRGMLNPAKEVEQSSSVNSRLTFKTNHENLLRERIESALAKTVGAGKVVARVNADYDFTQTVTTAETYDPDSKVVRQSTEITEGGATAVGAGPPGSSSNLPPGGASSGDAGGRSRSDQKFYYEIAKTTSQVTQTVPTLQRLTVSVLVDGLYEEVDDGSGNVTREYSPRPARELADLENSVKAIVGYSEERPGGGVDLVTVSSVQFQMGEDEFGEEAAERPLFTPDMIQNLAQWLVLAAISMMLIFLVLRPAVKSISVIASPAPSLPGPGAAAPGWLAPAAPAAGAIGAGVSGSVPSALPPVPQVSEELNAKMQQDIMAKAGVSQATRSDPTRAAGILRQWIAQPAEEETPS